MNTHRLSTLCLVLLLSSLCLLVCWSPDASVAQSSSQTAVAKELETDIGMPVLSGELWQKMTHDDKIAFVWGIWTVVSMESYFAEKHPDLRRETFSAKIYQASHKSPKTANEIVSIVNSYYQANADELDKPVIAVIWDQMVRPNITTGIADRPLKP